MNFKIFLVNKKEEFKELNKYSLFSYLEKKWVKEDFFNTNSNLFYIDIILFYSIFKEFEKNFDFINLENVLLEVDFLNEEIISFINKNFKNKEIIYIKNKDKYNLKKELVESNNLEYIYKKNTDKKFISLFYNYEISSKLDEKDQEFFNNLILFNYMFFNFKKNYDNFFLEYKNILLNSFIKKNKNIIYFFYYWNSYYNTKIKLNTFFTNYKKIFN